MGDEILELLIRRLDRIERLILDQGTARQWYTTEEFLRYQREGLLPERRP